MSASDKEIGEPKLAGEVKEDRRSDDLEGPGGLATDAEVERVYRYARRTG